MVTLVEIVKLVRTIKSRWWRWHLLFNSSDCHSMWTNTLSSWSMFKTWFIYWSLYMWSKLDWSGLFGSSVKYDWKIFVCYWNSCLHLASTTTTTTKSILISTRKLNSLPTVKLIWNLTHTPFTTDLSDYFDQLKKTDEITKPTKSYHLISKTPISNRNSLSYRRISLRKSNSRISIQIILHV